MNMVWYKKEREMGVNELIQGIGRSRAAKMLSYVEKLGPF
jgi:hypothetical protein